MLSEDFEVREEKGETFLALQNPPPVGSVVKLEGDGEAKHLRVRHVVEVAETPAGIGCFASLVKDPAPDTVGSESIAPDPEAVQAVIARDPSLASRYSGDASTPAQSDGAEQHGEPAAPASEDDAAEASSDAQSQPSDDAATQEDQPAPEDSAEKAGETQKTTGKKKGKKRKGRKRG